MEDHLGHAGMSMDMDMSMPMFFQATSNTILWLKSWHTRSVSSYAIALVGLALFAIAHEGFGKYRRFVANRKVRKPHALLPDSENAPVPR
jgi:hypothetical protein